MLIHRLLDIYAIYLEADGLSYWLLVPKFISDDRKLHLAHHRPKSELPSSLGQTMPASPAGQTIRRSCAGDPPTVVSNKQRQKLSCYAKVG